MYSWWSHTSVQNFKINLDLLERK
uniref:Uncharacterized protein n=1 Tax=Arundo donax TaxID=35708 RepID=A0A0A8Y738_ARUDO